ncbi:hypothetical protein GLOIN_2v1880126 [Rhizophagus clarus]|uniref:Uncharacterized protein n=1 Tax=Rhizophagus clarus TaxID=94130 RepID=A0A8H3R368_9GLOM|nr:hypothetical protein GLOIN_2v1880126 [Rhizophagus clarus]
MYQDFELRITYVGNNPNNVWQKINILQKYRGVNIFEISHPQVQTFIQTLLIPRCQPKEWHIINKMQALWNHHLRKFILASIQWNKFFIKWYNETKTVIELITSLKKIYPPDYIFNEREMRVWRMMLSHAGYVNITPYTKEISPYEFWTRSSDPTCDCEILHFLYVSEFLHLFPDQYYNDEYKKHLVVTNHEFTSHNSCINHCLLYVFDECNESHTYICNECQETFQFFQDLKDSLNPSCHEEIQEFQACILYYLAHQTRKIYLNAQFNVPLLDLNENGAILVVVYKMNILPKTSRETKQESFGKKGWALHTVLLYTKSKDKNLEIKPKWVSIISDNGPHYHNSELMIIMNKWYEWYRIQVKKWIFLEAGYFLRRIGREIQEGNDITLAIKDIASTSVTHIKPNQIKGENARYIKAQAIPNLGNWTLFSPIQIQNFTKGEINQPLPQVSESTNLKSP